MSRANLTSAFNDHTLDEWENTYKDIGNAPNGTRKAVLNDLSKSSYNIECTTACLDILHYTREVHADYYNSLYVQHEGNLSKMLQSIAQYIGSKGGFLEYVQRYQNLQWRNRILITTRWDNTTAGGNVWAVQLPNYPTAPFSHLLDNNGVPIIFSELFAIANCPSLFSEAKGRRHSVRDFERAVPLSAGMTPPIVNYVQRGAQLAGQPPLVVHQVALPVKYYRDGNSASNATLQGDIPIPPRSVRHNIEIPRNANPPSQAYLDAHAPMRPFICGSDLNDVIEEVGGHNGNILVIELLGASGKTLLGCFRYYFNAAGNTLSEYSAFGILSGNRLAYVQCDWAPEADGVAFVKENVKPYTWCDIFFKKDALKYIAVAEEVHKLYPTIAQLTAGRNGEAGIEEAIATEMVRVARLLKKVRPISQASAARRALFTTQEFLDASTSSTKGKSYRLAF